MTVLRKSSAEDGSVTQILAEAWDRFHPSILWWANRDAAVRPESAEHVYRELLSGPPGAMQLAVRLHKAMRSMPCR
jgi:hypothetical protein